MPAGSTDQLNRSGNRLDRSFAQLPQPGIDTRIETRSWSGTLLCPPFVARPISGAVQVLADTLHQVSGPLSSTPHLTPWTIKEKPRRSGVEGKRAAFVCYGFVAGAGAVDVMPTNCRKRSWTCSPPPKS
jgi:hypothetical protein